MFDDVVGEVRGNKDEACGDPDGVCPDAGDVATVEVGGVERELSSRVGDVNTVDAHGPSSINGKNEGGEGTKCTAVMVRFSVLRGQCWTG